MSDTRSTVNEFFRRLGAMDADGVAALFAEAIDRYAWLQRSSLDGPSEPARGRAGLFPYNVV